MNNDKLLKQESTPVDSMKGRAVFEARTFPRRQVLTGLVGATALGLAGCGPSNTGTTEPIRTGPAALPAYVPYEGVTPDVPGTPDGVPPLFRSYPNPPVVRDGFPLPKGAPFTALFQGSASNVSLADNKNFTFVAEQAGATFDYVGGGYGSDYVAKLQVAMAGGDIPDLCMIVSVAELPKLLAKHFTDLTDVLAGDGIKKYPALANIPTETWKTSSVNGRIYGFPKPLVTAGWVVNARSDVMAERGFSDPNVKLRDGAEFVDMLKQLTNRDKNQFALGEHPVDRLMFIMKQMCGAPTGWKNENGTFVHEIMTEEMKEALARCGEIVRAGYVHPEAFTSSQRYPWFVSGVTALYFQDFGAWGDTARNNPEWKVGNIEIPKWDGGGIAPIRKTAAGYYAYVAIKKSDDARLEQMLRFIDYCASPYGTQQFLDITYGIEDYSYRMIDGTPQKIADSPNLPQFIYAGGNHRMVLFGQDAESLAAQREYAAKVIPTGVSNASVGLYSETAATKEPTMAKSLSDIQRQVLLGEKPMSAWDEFVTTWRSKVGDAMAAEYAESAAQQ